MLLKKRTFITSIGNIFDIVLVTKKIVYHVVCASHGCNVAQTDTRQPLTAKGPGSISGEYVSDFRWTKCTRIVFFVRNSAFPCYYRFSSTPYSS
jgi:hypothetical protein